MSSGAVIDVFAPIASMIVKTLWNPCMLRCINSVNCSNLVVSAR
jgi:hypothetical protein